LRAKNFLRVPKKNLFMVALTAAIAVVFVVGLALRARHLAAMERLAAQRRRLGPDGIAIGGAGFALPRSGARAVLLIHGAGDTPQTLRYLGEALFARGFHVEAPLLPGHARTLRAFRDTSADDWINAVRAAHSKLKTTHGPVFVVGLSMGGALAVRLAAENRDVPAVCLLAPYLALRPSFERAARTSLIWGPLVPVFRSSEGPSILDPAEQAKSLAYGVFTAAALRALRQTVAQAREALPAVASPTLFVQSRGDNRTAPRDAEFAFGRIGAREKRLEWIEGAAHVITVDYGHERVTHFVLDWLEAHQPSSFAINGDQNNSRRV
jgi:carboxylesterase